MSDRWECGRLPGEPDEYWQCVECELVCLPDAVPAGAEEVMCPECGATMVHVSDDVPEAWDWWVETVEGQRMAQFAEAVKAMNGPLAAWAEKFRQAFTTIAAIKIDPK